MFKVSFLRHSVRVA